MRKNYRLRKILITAVLCPALVLGMAACGQNSGNAGSGSPAAGAESAAANGSEGDKTELVFNPPVDTPFVTPGEKDESVYVKADAAGRPTEKTVEVVLKKIEGSDPIEDRSNLREIKNTEGNEESPIRRCLLMCALPTTWRDRRSARRRSRGRPAR